MHRPHRELGKLICICSLLAYLSSHSDHNLSGTKSMGNDQFQKHKAKASDKFNSSLQTTNYRSAYYHPTSA